MLLIKEETLKAIADKTRNLAGLNENRKLSTRDILYWLGRLTPLDITWAFTDIKILKIAESNGKGIIPNVDKSKAVTNIKCTFYSTSAK